MLKKFLDDFILEKPLLCLAATIAVVVFFCFQAPKFRLDASPDSLVLENDQPLRYFRHINSQYGTNDYLVVTYTPKSDLFSEDILADLKTLCQEITKLDGIESIISILNVPLLFSPNVSMSDLAGNIRNLETPDTDINLAKNEFKENPIYSKQLLSKDGSTTAILVNLPIQYDLRKLLQKRTSLREKASQNNLSPSEEAELKNVSEEYRRLSTILTDGQNQTVEQIRQIMDRHRDKAELHLGGVPMIVSDMISFIRNDIIVFGIGVLVFLIITMTVIFRRKRWVILPMCCCFVAAAAMVGFLGMMDWRVTVISSNFISLMLIITISLTIHLIVKYRELCVDLPDATQKNLIAKTISFKFKPCLYTTLTTIVAFVSLLVSSIRPVMDFGKMMTIGLISSFVLSFLIFPAAAMLIKRENIAEAQDRSIPLTMFFASITKKYGKLIIAISLTLAIISIIGVSRLVVENRFIDYFRQSTEIYQGMKLIDLKLGGTTPLDVIIDLPKEEPLAINTKGSGDDDLLLNDEEALLLNDEADLLLGDDELLLDEGTTNQQNKENQWFTSYKLEKLTKIHNFMDSLPETGKVLSLATMNEVVRKLNNNMSLDDYELSILHAKLPDEIKDILVNPYVSVENNQVRFTMRVMESNKSLSRQNLLKKLHTFLVDEMKYTPEQFHFTNMLVLYNNMLQSLFRSQILTIGVVFFAIMLMFLVLFKSIKIATLAIIPNLLPAAMVLGGMGLFGIPLDMMTITIAAITIGIGVDNTIHYVHRFKEEFKKDSDYTEAMCRSHASIGKAMYYTSLTIIVGFSILVFSNFIPTIYFGLFTGIGMLAALMSALTLLPQLLIMFKPLGPENH